MNSYQIIKVPVLTEKTTALQGQNKYTFKVESDSNKIQIRKAIEAIYSVKVSAVNIINVEGKKRRVGRSPKVGKRSNWKKAIVTLKEGTIELV